MIGLSNEQAPRYDQAHPASAAARKRYAGGDVRRHADIGGLGVED